MRLESRQPEKIIAMLRRVLSLLLLLTGCLTAATTAATADDTVPTSQQQIQLSFAPVVRKAAPAVVNIYTRKVVQEQMASPFFNDPFFRQFFGDDAGGPTRERVQNSLGSGVIVHEDG